MRIGIHTGYILSGNKMPRLLNKTFFPDLDKWVSLFWMFLPKALTSYLSRCDWAAQMAVRHLVERRHDRKRDGSCRNCWVSCPRVNCPIVVLLRSLQLIELSLWSKFKSKILDIEGHFCEWRLLEAIFVWGIGVGVGGMCPLLGEGAHYTCRLS